MEKKRNIFLLPSYLYSTSNQVIYAPTCSLLVSRFNRQSFILFILCKFQRREEWILWDLYEMCPSSFVVPHYKIIFYSLSQQIRTALALILFFSASCQPVTLTYLYTLSIHRSIRIHQISTSHTNFDSINEWMNVCSSFWMKPLPFFSLRIFMWIPKLLFMCRKIVNLWLWMDGWRKLS